MSDAERLNRMREKWSEVFLAAAAHEASDGASEIMCWVWDEAIEAAMQFASDPTEMLAIRSLKFGSEE